MKSCEKFLDRLDDYVDGALPAALREECEAHATGCEDCAKELAAQLRLLELAKALPKSIEPRRDLWPAVAREVEPPVVSLDEARRKRGRLIARFAQVAAAALVVFAGVLITDASRRNVEPVGPDIVPVGEFAQAEQEYQQAKQDLLTALYASADAIPPETVSTVEENLRIIESAVMDIRVALEDNPDNPGLERILIATYKNQVNLLQRAVLMAHES